MKIALFLVVLILCAAYLYSASKDKQEASNYLSKGIQYGPFTVQVTGRMNKSSNSNEGIVNYTNVSYEILYEGKPVVLPEKLKKNTEFPFLSAVYALPGAPDPTLVAVSENHYLVYLKNGVLVVEMIIHGSNFGGTQFLDSHDGQPGLYTEVYHSRETTDLEKLDRWEGGRYLMLGEHTILDVQTRKVKIFNLNNSDFENYSVSSPHRALAFSPDQNSIVLQANFQSWNVPDEDLPDSEHALVVYDFEKDSGYVVKYDDTDTRMTNVNDVDFQWVNTCFEWKKSSAGHRLQLRQLDKQPNWVGKFDSQDSYYTIYPVKPEMLPIFLDFVMKQMNWSKENILKDETVVYAGRTINLGAGAVKVDINFQEDEQKMSFSKYLYDDESPESEAFVKKIGEAFNAELSAGKHQAHFGRIISETKRIKGLE
jgi:hypothetical protein